MSLPDEDDDDRRTLREQQLEAIYTASLDAIMVFGEDGTILDANEGASDMFGYPVGQLRQMRLVDLMPEEFVATEFRTLAQQGQTSVLYFLDRRVDRTGKNADGELFPFTAHVRSLSSAPPKRFIVIAEDRTMIHKSHLRIDSLNEQLRATNESLEAQVVERTQQLNASVTALAEANRKLELEVREREQIARSLQLREVQLERLLFKERELNEIKSRFVSMASHEFRTPLTTMLSSLEVVSMASEEIPAIVAKHLDRIRTNIGYLRNVLEDFLQLGKMETKGIDLNVQTFDLGSFLDHLIEDLTIAAAPGQPLNVKLRGDFGETRHLKNGLRIILSNLTNNAIKYSLEDSPVAILVERRGDRLHIEVSDHGIGIPDQDKANLFERFYRASNAETYKGTGLGLHITKQYVLAMNGTIDVRDNEAGSGTVFTVDLPYRLSR